MALSLQTNKQLLFAISLLLLSFSKGQVVPNLCNCAQEDLYVCCGATTYMTQCHADCAGAKGCTPGECTISLTPKPTLKLTLKPTTAQPTPKPTLKPTPQPTPKPTPKPTLKPTPPPTNNPTHNPSFNPSKYPTIRPTKQPTKFPTTDPTFSPSKVPTTIPTVNPTSDPTVIPTFNPTIKPTTYPTCFPTINPTNSPSIEPTQHPTINPSVYPTNYPTSYPTHYPTYNPTFNPTKTPTYGPTTSKPTINPTTAPTITPTDQPTYDPTNYPSTNPTSNPTIDPTNNPTQNPTAIPTGDPTITPSIAPTSPPTNSPTISPTNTPTASPIHNCYYAKYKRKMVVSKNNNQNEFLYGGETLVSNNCKFVLKMEKNGNLMMYVKHLETGIIFNGWKTDTNIFNYSGESVSKMILSNGRIKIMEYPYKNTPGVRSIELWSSKLNKTSSQNSNEISLLLTDRACLSLMDDNIGEIIWSACSEFIAPDEDINTTMIAEIFNTHDEQIDNIKTGDIGAKLWWLWLIIIFLMLVTFAFCFFCRNRNNQRWTTSTFNDIEDGIQRHISYNNESDTENDELNKWAMETNVTDNCGEGNENDDLFELTTATVMSQ